MSRLRAVIGAKDEQIAALGMRLEAALAGLEAARDRERRLELRVAELERRLSMDSTDSGTPSSKERIGAKEERRARQQSERERRKDRKRGGQPGHQGKGPQRDPDPGETKTADAPAECRSCKASLDGAHPRTRTRPPGQQPHGRGTTAAPYRRPASGAWPGCCSVSAGR